MAVLISFAVAVQGDHAFRAGLDIMPHPALSQDRPPPGNTGRSYHAWPIGACLWVKT
jgi:hypothetical protein